MAAKVGERSGEHLGGKKRWKYKDARNGVSGEKEGYRCYTKSREAQDRSTRIRQSVNKLISHVRVF